LGTIPPRGWTPESAPEARYNQQLIALCRTLQVPVGYIFEDFQAAGDRRKYMGGDGVHWTGEGMEIAGRAWGKTLAQLRFVLRDQ
jgi:lysophospholipase L1-like esterase